MGEILGLGMTHTPPLTDLRDTIRVKSMLGDPLLPANLKDPAQWPEAMKRQWGTDQGQTHAERHRAELIEMMHWSRKQIDDFQPDFILMWGDDQYENFKEDGVPAFCISAYESFDVKPWGKHHGAKNSWGEPDDKEFHFKGQRSAGKFLTTHLIQQGFDVAYAYKARYDPLPHAFLNTVLFLDWDRGGFPYPLVPFAINCYGRGLIALRGGGVNNLAQAPQEDELDPPSPEPWRCFDLGVEVVKALAASPWRVALVASSSWSHGFLSRNTSYFNPDVEADRRYYDAMVAGDYEFWHRATTADIERHGHQELLNWYCLLGAMSALGRKPQETYFLESWLTNADKVFAVFRP